MDTLKKTWIDRFPPLVGNIIAWVIAIAMLAVGIFLVRWMSQ